MLGRGAGLFELVERARDAAGFASPEADLADDILRYVLCGQYRVARALADLEREYVPDAVNELIYTEGVLSNWYLFAECVHLAAQIDDFLAVLEGDPRTASLARDCRGELDLLLVLADLCEDGGLCRSAKEARYLHGMAGSMGVDLWAMGLDRGERSRPEEDEGGEME